ncbi:MULTISPECIES: Eco57I restriction-modification methylase domain-containing protein [Kocuria]|uniref:Eco57I restriction-modification methylase domain-containing protein n=1 Tax=Kocuria TaxID=57493 RepID=UPI0007E9C148|nr:Eco57I restriction-modification methylase domain-containing protein [Kocuria sp. ICS0012]OBA45714.1 hypothetical protein A5728_00335 [Kocuria sp. ICS0012]
MSLDLSFAEQRRISTAGSITAEAGQVFTPRVAAILLASMLDLPDPKRLRILDPGAGTGILGAALVSLIREARPGTSVELVAVERDSRLIPALGETLHEVDSLANVSASIIEADYLLDESGLLGGHEALDDPFDLVIMNPPYSKLAAGAPERLALRQLGVEAPNLYAAFMALGLSQLRPGGQLVAIVPRSFMNGTYFESFRRFLLNRSALRRIHTFESRNTVFRDSGVLQESVIVTLEAGGKPGPVDIGVSLTNDPVPHHYTVDYEKVVLPTDVHKFIRIPDEHGEDIPADKTLAELGLSVATGRVVDFRARSYCLENSGDETVPLIYPGNFNSGVITWPRGMKRQKPQHFDARDDFSRKQVHAPGRYVVVKRFSAKEEPRRVVAAVWDGEGPVAFENKTNVIGPIPDAAVAIGLSIWLNSGPLDRLFRTFSGHTQVNAGDLRALPIPDEDTLRKWGCDREPELLGQDEIDRIVTEEA